MLSVFATAGAYAETAPLCHYTFDTATDASGQFTGSLEAGATLSKLGEEGILDLGPNGGYFDFGTSFGTLIKSLTGDFSITFTLFIPEETSISDNGNFIFNFSNSSDSGYMFFGAKESRYSITPTSWTSEQTVSVNSAFPKGEWVSVAIVRAGNNVAVWMGKERKQEGNITMRPSELGATPQNWLGRSPYNGDKMLKNARYADFRIYDSALTESDIAALAVNETLKELNNQTYIRHIEDALDSYSADFSDVRRDLRLPSSLGNNVSVTWESDNHGHITPAGKVTRPAAGEAVAEVKLTATASKGGLTRTREYQARVIPHLTDAEAAAYDLGRIELRGNLSNLRSDLTLPRVNAEGSKIEWKSSDESYLTSTGRLRRLAEGENHEVTLTATATRNGASDTRDFKVSVATPEEHDSYLFAFFPSNSDENLYYALSRDGFKYTVLNGDQRVMHSDSVAVKKGIRDPHILRGVDGKTFYMVATDMKSAEGWNSNRGIVMYKSDDLIHWKHSTINFPDRFPQWANVNRVWAPEVIWDPDYENTDGSKGRYMVYFSLYSTDGKAEYDKIYYCYANDDFTDLINDPIYLFDRGSATIDGDIIFDEATRKYHMFFKNEALGGICKVTADRLTAAPGEAPGSQWSAPSRTLQMTNEAVEGAGVFHLINSDTWVLMYDCYLDGHYQFCTTEDLEHFTLRAQTTTSGAFTPRHGTVMPLTPEETARLLEAFPPKTVSPRIASVNNRNTRQDNVTITATKCYIPVRPGTDLKAFDPELTPSFGSTITPDGPQDFTGDGVIYTVTNGTTTKEVTVTAAVEANPVLPGFNADPEVLYSQKTGRFYIYPTSDGHPGWGGYTFYAWSSADLVEWTREECILDLSTDDVSWATGNAWAPCIEEKFEDGHYRYYFYFSGHNPTFGYKTLGCAVSDSPTGPFHDLGHPLIEKNITGGQLIDSDVFTDPVSGKTYYYWGNGSLVASELTPDMMTISGAKVITPSGGSLSDYAFREGVYVFYRDGLYYFLWSVDDTGADNYHVAYGTSKSPMGPITVASKPIVIIKDTKNSIYGTGHNSIVQIPGRDEWYIVYHRINKNFRSNGPGYHREVCIDLMEFNEDGTIKQVTPTHTGIKAVDPTGTGVEEIMASEKTSAKVIATDYYDLSGIRLGKTPTARGMYIVVEHLDNGTVRTRKVAM